MVLTSDYRIIGKGKVPNETLERIIKNNDYDYLALEIVANMGMIVGATVFETAEMVGKITYINSLNNKPLQRIKRHDVKKHFKVRTRKKGVKLPNSDGQIRNVLINRFSKYPDKNYGKGNKKNPDFFYGFASDMWSAFAIACFYVDEFINRKGEDNDF